MRLGEPGLIVVHGRRRGRQGRHGLLSSHGAWERHEVGGARAECELSSVGRTLDDEVHGWEATADRIVRRLHLGWVLRRNVDYPLRGRLHGDHVGGGESKLAAKK